jgi:DNA-binding XRE family transcriptional regulator
MISAVAVKSALQFVAYAQASRNGAWRVTFPDIDGLEASAATEDEVTETALAVLEGQLRAELADGRRPSWPGMHRRAVRSEKTFRLTIPAGLAIAVQVRRLRTDNGWSQAELARRIGVSQQQVARVEDPDANPTVETVAKVAKAFDQPLVVVFGVEPR